MGASSVGARDIVGGLQAKFENMLRAREVVQLAHPEIGEDTSSGSESMTSSAVAPEHRIWPPAASDRRRAARLTARPK